MKLKFDFHVVNVTQKDLTKLEVLKLNKHQKITMTVRARFKLM